jgi:mannose/cellobiose epimerase-like protein (N-acyl-D-glucosamine 2-epimerase family)
MPNKIDFSFSDTIAGYITASDPAKGTFTLKTPDGRSYDAKLTQATFAEGPRNLGDGWVGGDEQMKSLPIGAYCFAHGMFYPEGGDAKFEAKHMVFVGQKPGEYAFEQQDWWLKQIQQLGEFYLKAQFEGGTIDFRKYRTRLTLDGHKTTDTRQETDTISRLIYGFASAYNITGDERFLEAAEAGTQYLRNHLRVEDKERGVTYWDHALEIEGDGHRRIKNSPHAGRFAPTHAGHHRGDHKNEHRFVGSLFGDDYAAMPAYEQIYALAGPTQTFRVTGDPHIRHDIDGTLALFEKYFKDHKGGGYYSHLDPDTFSAHSEKLGQNRAKKNWNSLGDHAPAYLINLWLATGEEGHAAFLEDTFDTIAKYFPDYENSPFVNEKFFDDWSHDQTWGWQQNRGVIGHNLKIAWNLLRMQHLKPKDSYLKVARKIAEEMPKWGMDKQRGGWYDVVERVRGPGEEFHRMVWHDRKAWWQQEQGILAYYIMAGSLGDDSYLKLARESAAFYNAWFLDHDDGAVYFNTLANGLPYLLGTERFKGSHSMSGYHSFELAYLCSIYSNLLVNKQPMDFYYKPAVGGFADNVIRVQPDIMPPGRVKIDSVTIDGKSHSGFDATGLTVTLPSNRGRSNVKVRLVPTGS